MKSENGGYVLMLSYIDENRMDIGGHVFPIDGFIESKNYEQNKDIRTGLNGILWGKTIYLPYENVDGIWVVIKTEISERFINIDSYHNRYKFKNGTIVYSGSLRMAAKYIIKNKNNEDYTKSGKEVQPAEIAGSPKWYKGYKSCRI